jgi:hypothetical protein
MPDVHLDPLPTGLAVRLTAFARACKGAARAAALYPPEHKAVGEALDRLAAAAGEATISGPLTMLVVPDNLIVDGRVLERHDLAVTDLAGILHAHRVGEITVGKGVPPASWRELVALLIEDPDHLRLRGGIARALTTAGALGIAVSEIDYAGLFEGDGAGSRRLLEPAPETADATADWAAIVARCLDGAAQALDADALRQLADIVRDPERLTGFFEGIDGAAGIRTPAELCGALLGTLQQVLDYLKREAPDEVEAAIENMASAFAGLSAASVVEMAGTGRGPGAMHADLASAIVGRIDDRGLARFISRSVARERHASSRLAEAVRLLAPDPVRRRSVAPLVHEELARNPACEDSSFDSLWSEVADMLTTYSDKAYVSDSYDRELASARHRATDLSRGFDDPPERIVEWLKTVADGAVRERDLQMLADLLAVQRVDDRRREAVELVMAQIEALADIGDFDGVGRLVGTARRAGAALVAEGHEDDVSGALDQLARGPLVARVAPHLQAARDAEFDQVRAICAALGPALVPRLAEVLSTEERPRARRRLAELILAFGEHGRASVRDLAASPNPVVRRTAVQLLRMRGGSESAPVLIALAADTDSEVRRDAARAILSLGVDESFDALREILAAPSHPGRATIVEELVTTRDQRAESLLCHVVQHFECKGSMRAIYLQSLERLGAIGGQDAVDALDDILNRRRFWPLFRAREVRLAAAGALSRINRSTAREALMKAAAVGSYGVRAAARRFVGAA